MNLSLIALAGLSFGLAIALTGWLRHRFQTQLLDIPNDRSSHSQPTPRGGGLGFIIAFAITTFLRATVSHYFPQISPEENLSNTPLQPFLLQLWSILAPLAIIGILDDRHNVPAAIRYLIQLATAGIAIAYFGSFPQPWLASFGIAGQLTAIALTLIAITALINFYNFMDGLDGLVSGVTAVQLGFFALYLNQPIWWLLVAALLGFLWWNWSPAKIFMGDVGSTVLGASVAIALLNSNNPLKAWSALAITLPLIADAIYTLIRRLIRRENIFQAHRTHLYQKLQQSGWTHAQVASTYIGFTLLVAASVITFGLVGAWISLVGVIGTIILGEIYLKTRRSALCP